MTSHINLNMLRFLCCYGYVPTACCCIITSGYYSHMEHEYE